MNLKIEDRVKIEKDVPMPPKWKDIVARMEVGDSFKIGSGKPGGTRSIILNAAKALGMKLVSRKVDGGVRFWRVK